jgi:hypothetical protein
VSIENGGEDGRVPEHLIKLYEDASIELGQEERGLVGRFIMQVQ